MKTIVNSTFNVPGEFVQGLVKAGYNLWQGVIFGWTSGTAATQDGLLPGVSPAAELQATYFQDQFELWARAITGNTAPVLASERGDRRFGAAE